MGSLQLDTLQSFVIGRDEIEYKVSTYLPIVLMRSSNAVPYFSWANWGEMIKNWLIQI